jgi:hypothetical protein
MAERLQKEHVSKQIESGVKSAFTRKYNSEHHSIIVGSATHGGRAPNLLYEIPETETDEQLAQASGDESEEGGAEDDIKKDRLIKKKAKPKGGAKKKASSKEAVEGGADEKPKKKPKTERPKKKEA